MTLLNPLALALGLFAVPIILMYVLKLRRQEKNLSSVLLWRRSLDDVQANAPWQHLRPNLLLLLQLLALFALVVVLAQPAYTRAHTIAGDLVVVVDESYGMQAHDVRPSRFAVALQQAHNLESGLSSGHVMSVIGMGVQPRLAIAESSNSGAIGRAIDSLRVGVSSPNFLAAMSLASSLARSGENTRVVVLTSRQSGISSLPMAVTFPVEIRRIGARLRDLGITAFSAVGALGHTKALVRVANLGEVTATSDLNLYVNGQLADVRPISVDPGKEQTMVWTNLPPLVRSLDCRITTVDDVAMDKSSWAVIPPPSTRHVLLVSGGNLFLKNALAAIPSVFVTQVKSADFQAASTQDFDLIVLDGSSSLRSSSAPLGTPILLVGPTPGNIGPLRIGKWMRASGMAATRVASPGPLAGVFSGVDLGDVHIARARHVQLPDWMQTLATSGQGAPLVAAGQDESRRLAMIAFNLQESDWPLRVSFPVVIQNLVQYLTPGLSLGISNLTVGQALKLAPPAGARDILVTLPDGSVDTVEAPFPPFAHTSLPGIYTVRERGHAGDSRYGSTASFSVNFFPSRPAPATGPAVQQIGRRGAQSLRAVPVLTDVDWVFWLLAMLILTGEWWFAFRR
jgi:Ca-activated chloride channel homolog